MITIGKSWSFYKIEKSKTIVKDVLQEVIHQEHVKIKKLLKGKRWYLR